MKGTKIILTLILPLLLWAGCSRMEYLSTKDIPDHCIELTLGGLRPSLGSKASLRGDDTYNENLVETVDCFFYPNGATGSNAVFMALGRGADAVAEGDSTVYKVKVFFTDADAIKMFGNANSGTCQFYVICNAPLSYGSSGTDINTLKNLVVENDFTAQTVQGSFVMSADSPGTVTLTTVGENRTGKGRVKVSRSCAKVQFYLNIPDVFLDEENHSWYPVLSAGVDITMYNAVKRGKVDGNYTVQLSDYVSYGSRNMGEIAVNDTIPGYGKYRYTHVPFYSYPCAWSDLSDNATTVVFRIAWIAEGGDSYIWKKYQLSPNVGTLDFKRNTCYRTFVAVHSLGGADKEEIVVIPECDYEIIPWFEESADAGQGLVPGQLITYKYLVVDEPEVTLNNEETAKFTYVSSSPLQSIYFRKVVFYDNSKVNPKDSVQFNSSTGTKTTEEGSITANGSTISYSMATPGLITVTHSLSGVYSQWTIYATIKNEDNCTQDIIITQNPSISLERLAKSGDVFVNGYFARVANSPFGNSWTTNDRKTVYRDPKSTNGAAAVTMPSPSNEYGATIYKGEGGTGITTFYTTEIRISSFNSTNNTYSYTYGGRSYNPEYRIGDPRKTSEEVYNSSWSLHPYLYYNGTNQGATASWESPLKILMTSQDLDDQNIVAPRFLVSSALNSMLTTNLPTFDQAVSRAAVYQEAGYPAGRWRIPTEAEMAFIVARQLDNTIPELYVSGSDYWSGSGRLMTISGSGASISLKDGGSSKESVRFVYDLWYWGDEPSTTNVYHPNGHIYDYDSAGNATQR
jgi:hypothetical protein